MSIWVTVYCRRPIGAIDPPTLVVEIRQRAADFSELFAQEDPGESLSRLRIEEVEPNRWCLDYLPSGIPVGMSVESHPEVVRGEIDEYLEERFQDKQEAYANVVRDHLRGVTEIVHFCLKQTHADGMGMAIVYAAAAWLADVGDGLVRADEQGWMQLTEWGEFTIMGPE